MYLLWTGPICGILVTEALGVLAINFQMHGYWDL